MKAFEYKVLEADFGKLEFYRGILSPKSLEQLEETLNSEGREGWRLINSIVIAEHPGGSAAVIIVLMREKP